MARRWRSWALPLRRMMPLGKRVNAVHRKAGGAWTLLHWCGRGVSWPVHDWAVAQFVPIIYLGDDRDRMSEAHLVDLARRADTVVVFEERGQDHGPHAPHAACPAALLGGA